MHVTGIERMFVHPEKKVKRNTWSMRRTALLSALLALALAGCGDDGGDDGSGIEDTGGADPEAVEVIEGWSDSLREGKVVEAAEYFRIPSVAENGTPPLDLDTERKVLLFNAALPCGAELTETEQRGEYVIATFELTERPGPGECGTGVGVLARTAFRIEDGLIVEWRRAPNVPGSEQAPEGQVI
jgi:hypothetical protein